MRYDEDCRSGWTDRERSPMTRRIRRIITPTSCSSPPSRSARSDVVRAAVVAAGLIVGLIVGSLAHDRMVQLRCHLGRRLGLGLEVARAQRHLLDEDDADERD